MSPLPDSWVGYHIARAVMARGLLRKIYRSRGAGIVSHFRLLGTLPYFWVYYLWVCVVGVFSTDHGRLRMAAFLKHYFWWHMRSRGVTGYLTCPEPPYEGKGMLILSVRQDPMGSLLFQQEFSYPVIVPMHPKSYRFPFSVLWPWRGIGRALSVVTYPDHGLDSDLDTILALLEAGYPVLVYVNPGLVSTPDMPNVMVYGGLTRLLQWAGPIYAAAMEGMHLYPAVTMMDPFTIRLNMVSLASLVTDIPSPTRTQQLARMMRFLGFHDYRFVSEPWQEGAAPVPASGTSVGDMR